MRVHTDVQLVIKFLAMAKALTDMLKLTKSHINVMYVGNPNQVQFKATREKCTR